MIHCLFAGLVHQVLRTLVRALQGEVKAHLKQAVASSCTKCEVPAQNLLPLIALLPAATSLAPLPLFFAALGADLGAAGGFVQGQRQGACQLTHTHTHTSGGQHGVDACISPPPCRMPTQHTCTAPVCALRPCPSNPAAWRHLLRLRLPSNPVLCPASFANCQVAIASVDCTQQKAVCTKAEVSAGGSAELSACELPVWYVRVWLCGRALRTSAAESAPAAGLHS